MRLAGAILMLSAATASAQPLPAEPARVVVWVGPVISAPSSGGTLTTDYAPVLEAASGYTSHATQTLNIDRERGAGVEAGADIFFWRAVGIEAAVVHSHATVSGSDNSAYQTSLRYIGMQPPDYIPREYTAGGPEVWPDTTGSVSSTSVLLGGVVRLGSGRSRVGGTVGAGISRTKVNARVESVGYTSYRLGGHSVLFDFQHRLAVGTSGSDAVVRPYLSGQIDLRLNSRLSIVTGLRAVIGSTADVTAHAADLVEPDDSVTASDLAVMQSVLAMGPMRLPTTRWHLTVGLRCRLK
jgi:hypothetical protein